MCTLVLLTLRSERMLNSSTLRASLHGTEQVHLQQHFHITVALEESFLAKLVDGCPYNVISAAKI